VDIPKGMKSSSFAVQVWPYLLILALSASSIGTTPDCVANCMVFNWIGCITVTSMAAVLPMDQLGITTSPGLVLFGPTKCGSSNLGESAAFWHIEKRVSRITLRRQI